MSRVYSFKATLIGANKQQNVNFCLESAGISISESGDRSQVIANLSFPYIVKISRSPCGQGTPRILDISVHTKAGVQNLKVLVDSAKAADQLLDRFQKLAAAYKEQECSPACRKCSKPVTPTFSGTGSFSRIQGINEASNNIHGTSVTFAGAPVPGSEVSPSTAVEQQPAGITSLQNSKGAEPDDTQLVHARQQIRFLEGYVSRLTSRLGQMQQEQGKKLYIDADSDAEIAAVSQADGSGELKWHQVQPLLTEYDEMIYTLQAKLSERQEELGRFEVKLDEISSENAQLVDKLKLSLKEIATMAVFEVSTPSEEHIKRADLLHHENNVLAKQNAELDKEVARLNTDNESIAKQLLDATQKLNDLQSQARELEEQLAEEHICREDAQQTAADLEALRQKHAQLVAQHDATVKCAEEASATAVALRAELDASRADLAEASRDALASNAASEELRETVVTLRKELAEHRERDAEAVAHIQDAKDLSEQCELAKQASERRESHLQDEIGVLQKLYSEAQAKLAGVSAAASSNAEVVTLTSELARIKQAYSSLEDTIAQVRNSNKKLEKEKWALHARLQENLRETPSADDLATLRRALDAERECESVKMQLESMKRTAKQHRLEDDVHVKKLEAQLEEANRTIASWTVSKAGTKQDVLVLDKELESTRKQLQTLSENSARTEAHLRGEIAHARGEHSSEVQMLVTKLEESVTTYNTSVAEAERMMSAKEELLRKYKEESLVASSKLMSYQGIVNDKDAQIASLQSRLGRVQRDRDKLKADLVDAEAAAGFGRAAREQAIKASREVADLQNRHEDESRKRRQLEMQLERTKLTADRATRRNGELNPIQSS